MPHGTAPHRTQLAWSRTTLTLVAGGLTLTRLLWPFSNTAGAMVLAASVSLAAVLVGLTALRDHNMSKEGARGADGMLLAVVAAGTCAIGIVAIVLVALG